MRSSNPVFANNAEFNGRNTTQYADPSQWKIDLSGSGDGTQTPGLQAPTSPGRMTLDTVVEKTAITLGLVVLGAAVAWFMIGDIDSDAALATAWTFSMGGALIGFVLAMVNSFKKVISPPLVMAYALVEGVFVGAFSKIISTWVGDAGIVFQAVLATFVAAAATLAAYKFFNIQVTAKFRRVVMISLFAFMGVMVLNLVLSLFGVFPNGGLRSMDNPMLAILVGGVAIVLGVLCLIMDFDFVERGVEAGLPERESWRAAFGLTVTLVWLYLEILRLLAILRGDS
ncbi:Bax inhibitor-1/YccA family protein [Aeromicrobium tamlense]|uniref:Bax inhibitor-1/YccA family protein n=1 Tax=Aeromicrobium tamlense TaxID=375541 RepID=A0A8I0FUC0_9ACTN|nr:MULTISPECIES: Bax inhibitor-1/YccA family protein [Aeromicrobium]MBD1269066.1 Bax inhibitor-1/YccA family protein [Aeromicrobium tamlense]NYI37025.1 putative YccA/Bax inhibitor family protein [Aeromicrobium tamlense]